MNAKSPNSSGQWVDPDDVPELDDEFFKAGVWRVGDKIVSPEQAREAVQKMRGRPAGSGSKVSTTIRFDADVLAAFKATGAGWQTRMNDVLKEWLRSQ
jgi:uncharacterized protein (DUF4415 family)